MKCDHCVLPIIHVISIGHVPVWNLCEAHYDEWCERTDIADIKAELSFRHEA